MVPTRKKVMVAIPIATLFSLHVLLLVVDNNIQSCNAFQRPLSFFHTSRHYRYETYQNIDNVRLMPLLAARSPFKAANGGGKKKKSGTKNNNHQFSSNIKKTKSKRGDNGKSKSNKKNNSYQSNASASSSPMTANNGTKKKKGYSGNGGSHSPPWQVVSNKDMKKVIEIEQERRELAQQGFHTDTILDEAINDGLELSISKTFLDPADKSFLGWKRFSATNSFDIEFIGAYLEKRLPPRLGVPEIAFLGRSNVGKSSLLNKLVGSETARVGKTPGATASVNLYAMYNVNKNNKNTNTNNNNINNKAILGLADLPGFGYAKLSKETKMAVEKAAENYLKKRKELVLGILLVDIRREPSVDDRAVLAALYDSGIPIVVVATKIDKLSSNDKIERAKDTIRIGLGLPQGQPLCVSSVTGNGIKELWKIILDSCEMGVEEFEEKLQVGGEQIQEEEDVVYEDDYYNNNNIDDTVAYSQGYDWVHDSEILYEGDELDYVDMGQDDNDDDDDKQDEDNTNLNDGSESMRDLRKRARSMQRRGEI